MKFVLDSDVFIEAARPKGNPAVHRWLFAWLAALACRRGARLATRSTAHFQPLVDCGTGLLLVNPWDN